MRDVKDADAFAHRVMLGDNALILQRHLPAGKGRESCAKRLMALAQDQMGERAWTAVVCHRTYCTY